MHASSTAAPTLLVYARLQRTTARYDLRTTTPWTSALQLSMLSATPRPKMTLHTRATPVRIQHPPYGSASPLHTTRRRLRSTSQQATSCVLDLPRPRSSAASIICSPAAVARGFPQQSPRKRDSGRKRERARVGGRGAARERSGRILNTPQRVESMRSSRWCWNRAQTGDPRSQKRAAWGAQHWSREELSSRYDQRLSIGPCQGWAVWTYTTMPFAVLTS
ncbi:hypothetical protein C8R45DRAFT_598422 [Mycena sanguinolenta]|nr:hypothetical protein C8R45DRAFT_598422 [Mycena sanguinolenta]